MATSIAASGKSVWGFSPQSIPGCSLWLDGGDRSSMVISGTSVTQWNDKSGTGNNFTGSATYALDSSFNNKFGLAFDGTNNYFNQASGSVFSITNTTYCIFTAHHFTTNGGGTVGTVYRTAVPNPGAFFRQIGGAVQWLTDLDPAGYITRTATGESNSGINCINAITTTSVTAYLNGTSVGSSTKGSSTNMTFAIGQSGIAAERLIGTIFEMIIFNNTLTDSQRQQVEGYLAAKWGLGMNLPPTHPYSSVIPILPTQIPGCTLWLDAADSTSMTLSGTSVTSWNDKSGNGYNASGGVSPTYSSNVIQFNGSSYLSTSIPAGSNSASYFFVFSPSTTGSTVPLGGNALSTAVFIQGSTSIALGDWNTNVATFSTALNAGTTYIASGMASGGVLSVGINGATMATGSATFSGTGTFTVGAGYTDNRYKFLGSIGEIILFNTALSTSQRQLVEQYLGQKWKVSVANAPSPGRYLIPTNRPFRPVDIPGCSLWLDAADSSTITGTSPVTAWNDKSGNGLNAAATGTSITISTLNGLPAINYDGNSYLTSALTSGAAAPFSIFVIENQASALSLPIYTTSTSTDANGLFLNNYGNDYLTIGSSWAAKTSTINPNQTYLLSIVSTSVSAGTITLYANGTSYLSGTTTGNFSWNTFLIGKRTASGYSDNYAGKFGEIIIFNSALSTPQRQQVEQYLTWKWGLPTANLPTGHPGKLLPAFGTPFTPKSVTGLQLWLDAADPSTITGTSTVTAWADKSGNGNSVTSTAGFGTMTLSNNPVNGKTSIFSSGQNCLQVPSFTITAGQSLTAFHLVVPTLAGGDIVGLHLGPNQGGTGTYFGDMGYQNTNGNTSYLFIPTTNGGMDNTYAYTPALTYQNTFVILTATYNGGTTLLGYYNGNKQGPSTLTSSLNLNGQPLRIGSRNSSQNTYGHICESILYFGLLTTPQIQQVEGYLAWKWGLQSSLPSTHAYAKFSP